MPSLAEELSKLTVEGDLSKKSDGKIQCLACAHMCKIADGADGICKVRFNKGGKLFVPHGYTAGIGCDPIEKKPFFHFLPGTDAFSFGMLGCNFKCPWCQNWLSSQALKDPSAGVDVEKISSDNFVGTAGSHGAASISSTYNEPLITTEWAVEIFKKARPMGLKCTYVSNGYASDEVLEYLSPHLDGMNVDLKGFSKNTYGKSGGLLENVLKTIRKLHEMKIWIEVVTLVIPNLNDSDEELKKIAEFIVSVSPDIPWHVTAFRRHYKMQSAEDTPPSTILKAAKIGKAAGLKFVYAGNLPGMVDNLENTYCPKCGALLIERFGYAIHIKDFKNGHCSKCDETIPGVWK